MPRQESIYRVAFREPPREDGKTDYYFTSLAAIYDTFTPDEVGCTVEALWSLRLRQGNRYAGDRCTITRETLSRKAQTNPHTQKTGEGQ